MGYSPMQYLYQHNTLIINNQMSQQTSKKIAKNQAKIHRRKNQEINKDYDCPVQSCQKAYGSYAALYTHIKNKHPNVKPPNMPNQSKAKQNLGQPGRPKIKKVEQGGEGSDGNDFKSKYVCKLCLKEQCVCVQSFDFEEKNKIIGIMGDNKFINFTNQIGQLGDQTFSWVRRTEDQYQFKSIGTINEEILIFNKKYEVTCNLSALLISFLSFSSKFWDKLTINELYETIYAIMAFQNYQVTLDFIRQNKFPRMEGCMEANPTQFKRFETMIRLI